MQIGSLRGGIASFCFLSSSRALFQCCSYLLSINILKAVQLILSTMLVTQLEHAVGNCLDFCFLRKLTKVRDMLCLGRHCKRLRECIKQWLTSSLVRSLTYRAGLPAQSWPEGISLPGVTIVPGARMLCLSTSEPSMRMLLSPMMHSFSIVVDRNKQPWPMVT